MKSRWWKGKIVESVLFRCDRDWHSRFHVYVFSNDSHCWNESSSDSSLFIILFLPFASAQQTSSTLGPNITVATTTTTTTTTPLPSNSTWNTTSTSTSCLLYHRMGHHRQAHQRVMTKTICLTYQTFISIWPFLATILRTRKFHFFTLSMHPMKIIRIRKNTILRCTWVAVHTHLRMAYSCSC